MEHQSQSDNIVAESKNFLISKNDTNSLLTIQYRVVYWELLVFIVGLVIQGLLVFLATISENGLIFLVSVISGFFIIYILGVGSLKRMLLSSFDLEKNLLVFQKGGIFGSNFDKLNKNIDLSLIDEVQIKEYSGKYQIRLTTVEILDIEITGRELSLPIAQLCAEIIKDFLKFRKKDSG